MDTLTDLIALVRLTLAQLDDLSLTALPLLRRDETVVALGTIALLALGALLTRYVTRRHPGRTDIALPALPPSMMTKRSALAPLRHTAFVLFLVGLPFFAVSLADPHTTLIQERSTAPGHRIAILIDASMSMDTAFATDQLGWATRFWRTCRRQTTLSDGEWRGLTATWCHWCNSAAKPILSRRSRTTTRTFC